tara:strand:- start:4 stop:1773 length:1770 start_codon:yes stop_codon:yes gene_type:complete
MAIEKTITITAKMDTSEASSKLDRLETEIQNTQTQVRKTIPVNLDTGEAQKNLRNVKEEAKGVATTLPEIKDGAEKASGGIRGISLAWKALGIGAVISALTFLADKFSENQKVMDAVRFVSVATGEVLVRVSNIVIDFGEKVINAFKTPVKTIMNFNNLIKDKVNKTIMDTIKGLGLMGKAIGKVFKGEFKEAAQIAKEGAKTLFNANPIVQATNAAKDYATAIFDVGKSTFDAATEIANTSKEIVELTNKVKLSEAEQRKVQLTYQKEAELQRQLRDDTSASIDDRIAANERLGEVLQEQFEKEKALVLEKIRLKQLELAQNQENVDLQVALINAETELADLEERITGQKSENLTNENALIQEQIDKETDLYGGEAREKMIQAVENFGYDVTEIRQNTATKSGEWTNQALKDFVDSENIKVTATKATAAAREAVAKSVLGSLGKLAGEGTKMAKGAALASILMDTAKGISAAIAGATAAAAGTGPAAIFTQPLYLAQMIGSVLSGIASAKGILAKVPGGGGGGSENVSVPSSGGGASLGARTIPNMENIGTRELGQETPVAPVQAYVVENDISSSQALQEELETQATL